MSITDSIKRIMPKTPKQWAIAAAGGGAALLGVNYLYARDDSYVARWYRQLFHPHGGAGRGGTHRAHPAFGPHMTMPPGTLQSMVMPPMQTSPMVVYEQPGYYWEPAYGGWGWGHGWGEHGHGGGFEHGRGGGFEHGHGGGGFEHGHGGGGGGAPHRTGAPDAAYEEPRAPLGTRTPVPPPGSRGGVVSPHPQYHEHRHPQASPPGAIDVVRASYGWE